MEYVEPNFVDEALVVLERYGDGARVLAGGTIVASELRKTHGIAAVVNVKRIAAMRIIEIDGDLLRIGALATARTLGTHGDIATRAPLVAQAANSMGAPALRTSATIGGNVLSRHHAADLAVALVASDAVAVTCSLRDGALKVPVRDLLTTTLDPRALLTAFEIPLDDRRCAFAKMQTRRAFELAVVSSAAALRFSDGRAKDVRIAIGGAASIPIRAYRAEAALAGAVLDDASIAAAARAASDDDAIPDDDRRASAAYRRHLAGMLTARALREIAAHAHRAA